MQLMYFLIKVNLISLINENINLMSELNNSVKINFNYSDKKAFLMCDTEQIKKDLKKILKNFIEKKKKKKKKHDWKYDSYVESGSG